MFAAAAAAAAAALLLLPGGMMMGRFSLSDRETTHPRPWIRNRPEFLHLGSREERTESKTEEGESASGDRSVK